MAATPAVNQSGRTGRRARALMIARLSLRCTRVIALSAAILACAGVPAASADVFDPLANTTSVQSPSGRYLVTFVAGTSEADQAATVAAADLTERELDVLRLLADGRDNRQIAEALYLSPTTVKRHVSSIVAKLGVSNRVQAAIWAVRAGLL